MIEMPTGLKASSEIRVVMHRSLGPELYDVLERVGAMAKRAGRGDRDSQREMRRIRYWLGATHWHALCLMLDLGRITNKRIVSSQPIKASVCRDALVLILDLEGQRMRWGME